MAPLTHHERRRRWSLDDIVVTDPPIIRRAIGAAAIGNITEWFDFGVYAYFEPTIVKVFFSNLDETTGHLVAFALFAVAFLVRPFGGMFFGPLADRIGRNRVLATTMIMMAAGTFAIGCIPSPQSIGLAAPILLLVCRLIQGFSTGGEYGNAMTFIAEYAPDRRRGFLGSWLEFGTFTGYLMGAIAVTIASVTLSPDQLTSWGWRVPFLLALPLGVVGVYLRARLADTPAFQQLEAESEAKEKEVRAGQEWKDIFKLWPFMLVCMGGVIAWNVTNYMLTAYMPSYVATVLPEMSGNGISSEASQIIQVIVMAVALVTIPFLGLLSDRVGRKPIIWVGALGITFGALPMFWLLQLDNVLSVFIGLMIMALFLICFSATMPSTLPSLFPTRVRAGALSIAFNVAISIFCGTTAVICNRLVEWTHNLYSPAWYLIFAGVVGIVAVYFTKEPNGRRMWGSAPSAVDETEARHIVENQDELGHRLDS